METKNKKIKKRICIKCKINEVVCNNNIPLLCCYNCYEKYYNNNTWKNTKKIFERGFKIK